MRLHGLETFANQTRGPIMIYRSEKLLFLHSYGNKGIFFYFFNCSFNFTQALNRDKTDFFHKTSLKTPFNFQLHASLNAFQIFTSSIVVDKYMKLVFSKSYTKAF